MIQHLIIDPRLRAVSAVFILLAVVIIARLFILQILQHDYYTAFAMGAHEIYQKLHPKRGAIFFLDSRNKTEYPAAVNRQYENLYAVPQEILKEDAIKITDQLAEILKYDETKKTALLQKLLKEDDPYEPIEKKLSDDIVEKIKAQNWKGIYFTPEEYRYYPEDNLAAQALGFYGVDKDGNPAGLYGLEGYWNRELAGKSGFLLAEKGAKGGWISLAGRTTEDAENGANIILTLDRAIEYKACERLKAGLKEFEAASASLIMLDAKTGAVLAMCNEPDFNPNEYSKVDNLRIYNNDAIFTAYEPGSVFKPVTMAAAVDLNLVQPETTFVDPCEREIDDFKVHNAENKCYGKQTMTGVLENSINTGMIWVQEKMQGDQFVDYVKKFGFGERTGISLETEAAGDISSLDKKGHIYKAVGSYGQGLTVTPVQLAMAYTALANEGQMMRPFIVEEVRFADGRKEKTEPQVLGQIIAPRTAKLLTGMLVSVVEKGHSKGVKMDDYYIAGKTGTAQIAGKGGYSKDDTNHTFVGYAPANNPKFVLVVKFEKPQRAWAEATAVPVFRDVAEFTLKYFGIKGDK